MAREQVWIEDGVIVHSGPGGQSEVDAEEYMGVILTAFRNNGYTRLQMLYLLSEVFPDERPGAAIDAAYERAGGDKGHPEIDPTS
jgi:hypothetical protein